MLLLKHDNTPLSRAVFRKRFEVIRFLLSKGAIGDTRAAVSIRNYY